MHDRGRESFASTLAFQLQLRDAKISEREFSDCLITVEHEHVYTVGRGVPFQNVVGEKSNIPWHEISRGGEATYHGPGQLVVYPIFNLEDHGKDVHVFLRKLEQVTIHALAKFGIAGIVRTGLTGVWLQNKHGEYKKIASIGIGLKRWVSYHGIAINLNPELSYFDAISPCGLETGTMTSIKEVLSNTRQYIPSMDELREGLIDSFLEIFDLARDKPTARAAKKPRPAWLKVKAPGSPDFQKTNEIVRAQRLVTVCEEAHCPNIGECWTHHTATFMIMGELCTRRCSFCAVKDGAIENLQPLDPFEPLRVATAVKQLNLQHVVITSVNRDDLDDMGAEHFNQTVKAIVQQSANCKVELLIPDMRGKKELVRTILKSNLVSVLNHNVETVPSLYKSVRPGAIFERSLNVLAWAKELSPHSKTKSGLMLGLGETWGEVLEVMDHLREAGCEILTLGQYLQPTKKQLPVQRYITPEEFVEYKQEADKRGFSYVESGPLVRSSYHAWQHSAEPGMTSAIAA